MLIPRSAVQRTVAGLISIALWGNPTPLHAGSNEPPATNAPSYPAAKDDGATPGIEPVVKPKPAPPPVHKPWHPAVDPSHDLTVGEFGIDILRNVGFSKSNIAPALVGGAATGLATIPEDELVKHFAPGNVWGSWSEPGKYIPYVEAGASGVMFLVSRKSTDYKFRAVSYALAQGLIVDTALTYGIKAAVGRERPNGEDHSSFPSNHASRAFTFATIVSEHYGWKAAVPSYAVAAYVAATRLEERKHYLSDVVAGAALGFLIGHTVCRRMKRYSDSDSRVSWTIQPGFRTFRFTVAIRVD